MIIFHVIPFAIFLYVAWRFVLPLPGPAAWKGLAALALLAIAQQHLIVRTFFGSLASPELPYPVLVAVGWLFGAFILLAALLLLKDAAAVLLLLAAKAGLSAGISVSGVGWALGAAVAAIVLSAFGVWQAVRVPDVRTVDIAIPGLPAELDGLRLVQISDLHASRLFPAPWVEAVVDKANALDTDVILMTGDQADGPTARRATDVAPLKGLKARHGVFAITGNHEYYSGHAAWMAALEDLGMRVLMNEHVVIGKNGRSLVLAGITDNAALGFSLTAPDIGAALAGAPKDAPVVLMAHRPPGAARHAEAGVNLQLSGHTHGGQIPGIRELARHFNEGFVSGLYTVGGMQLYVSNGTGLWPGFPLRLGAPSEITQIVLRARAAGQG